MLRRAHELHGVVIHARDGIVGNLDEILFDDAQWTVRYLVVETGTWLNKKKVLLSPIAIGFSNWENNILNVNLTRTQIENSPDVETDEPVSRHWEARYHEYYGWPYYWGGPGGWGSFSFLNGTAPAPASFAGVAVLDTARVDVSEGDCHLRSSKEVIGYRIAATDGYIGHVDDFIVDDQSWRIRYIAADTRVIWPDKRVLLPLNWIESVDWPDHTVKMNISCDQIENAPEWDHHVPISAEFEDSLYCYCVRQWPAAVPANEPKKDDLIPMV